MQSFKEEVEKRIDDNQTHDELRGAARSFVETSIEPKYVYNFTWLGRPIIQFPQDVVAMQQLIWAVQPDLIIETGIAHGGSIIFSASMLELNAACGGPRDARVVGIDIDVRAHNRRAIEAHPLSRRISMIEGSSTAPEVIAQVETLARDRARILVALDSNHTHAHVLEELEAYARFVTPGSYCVVFDTIIEDLPDSAFPDRPWGPGNSPKSAVREFLSTHPEFETDRRIDNQLLISANPSGYLRRRVS